MRLLTTIVLTFLSIALFGQGKDSIDSTEIICFFEPMPSYPGGYTEMNAFIKKNLKYPRDSRTVHGNVFIGFVVNEDGSLSDFKVVRGLADSFDNSALETIKKMPHWIPAKKDNKPIRTKVVIPIKFN